jgi:hypothetical protein
MRASDWKRTEGGGELLHPQKPQSKRHSRRTDINRWADGLVLRTVYKWHKRLAQGRTKLSDDPRSERPLRNGLAEAVRAMLQDRPVISCKRLCVHFRLATATCVHILHDFLQLKSSIYVGLRTLLAVIKKPNGVHFLQNCSKF